MNVSITTARTIIYSLIAANQSIMLHGSPGIGKSQLVRQIAAELKLSVIDMRLSQMDPVDLRGVPSVFNGVTNWNTPASFPNSGKGVLFLDEINSAPVAVQTAAYQLILDRCLGDYKLPDGWIIIAAGNRMSDNAIVTQMSTALRNRFAHVFIESDIDSWTKWAIKSNLNPVLIAFLNFKPNLLDEFVSPDSKKTSSYLRTATAFATPRSWAMVNSVLATNPPENVRCGIISGIVGDGNANEFSVFMDIHDKLPKIAEVLADPMNSMVPTEVSAKYSIIYSLAMIANDDNLKQIMSYLTRFELEYQILGVKTIRLTFDGADNNPSVRKWSVANYSQLSA